MNTKERIIDYMSRAGCSRIRVSGDEAVATCPFHNDTKPSFAMNLRTGLFICYSAHCGVTGNIINFLHSALNFTYDRARTIAEEMLEWDSDLQEHDPFLPDWDYRHEKGEVERENTPPIREAQLALYYFLPRSLANRGFDPQHLKAWEIGFDYGTKRVTIPVRDREGKLVGITKRAARPDQEPKYLHLGFQKGQYLYGYHREKLYDVGTNAIVVEGQLDAVAWDCVGWEYLPLATMGTKVTKHQANMLVDFERVLLAFDNDPDGWAATAKVGDILLPKVGPNIVFVATKWPRGATDIAMFLNGDGCIEHGASEYEIEQFVTDITPYDLWRVQNVDKLP